MPQVALEALPGLALDRRVNNRIDADEQRSRRPNSR